MPDPSFLALRVALAVLLWLALAAGLVWLWAAWVLHDPCWRWPLGVLAVIPASMLFEGGRRLLGVTYRSERESQEGGGE